MNWLKQGLSHLYEGASELKNIAYDKALIKTIEVSKPVISVGNLTVGGTGKTPLIDWLAKYFVAKDKKVAVISRNYRAETKSISKVHPDRPQAAQFFGDEPTLLAQRNPKAKFFVGPSKSDTAQFVDQNEDVDVLLVDDGFQHRRLHRDLDIVVLDATEPLENYALLPKGRGRESCESLERADIIVLTKCNLVTEAQIEVIQDNFHRTKPWILLDYKIQALKEFRTEELWSFTQRPAAMVAFCGLGRPSGFFDGLSEFLTFSPNEKVEFPDHFQYTKESIDELLTKYGPSSFFVTTEKDAIKLAPVWPVNQPLYIAMLSIEFRNSPRELYEKLEHLGC